MACIVLHHGVLNIFCFELGPLKIASFGTAVERTIAERGHSLIASRVHPTGGIARRASELKDIILSNLARQRRADERVVVIAHSMGGLDARYMISRLAMSQRVSALVTISTPHRGNACADFVLKNVGMRLGALAAARRLNLDIGAMEDLTTPSCERFNLSVPDAPGVRYFSITASRPLHRVPIFSMPSWQLVNAVEGENDGLVSVKSARWGTHLETWPLDHWQQIGRRLMIRRNGEPDAAEFYGRLMNQLSEHGVV